MMKKILKYEFNLKKIDSQFIIVCIYDIETYIEDGAVPYEIGCYPVSKISKKWKRHLA